MFYRLLLLSAFFTVTSSHTALASDIAERSNVIADFNGLNLNNLMARYNNKLKDASTQGRKLNKLLIFISLSMPQSSIRMLDQQAKQAGGLLVLRGLVNNSYKDTAKLLAGISDEGINAVIDPRLFEVFAIDAVPAFVITPTDSYPCGDKKCSFTPIYDKLSGNVTLQYALNHIKSYGTISSQVANEYLVKLRGDM